MATRRPLRHGGYWLAFAAAIAISPLTFLLESTMVSHVLIEIPLFIALGVMAGRCLQPLLQRLLTPVNGGGIPGILVASFGLAFWMIPRWLDASLSDPMIAAAKYASLVGLVGIPLAWSWSRLHPVARGVVKIEFLSMLLRLGWLYLISPDRFCNNYLLSDQVWLGRGFLLLGLVLSIAWLVPVFFGSRIGSANDTHRTSPTSDSRQVQLR